MQFSAPKTAPESERGEIERQVGLFLDLPFLKRILDAIPQLVIVLNSQRRIVFSNRAFLEFVGAEGLSTVVGFRFGDKLGCVHARCSEGGCGTTKWCNVCAAYLATQASLNQEEDERECSFSFGRDSSDDTRDFKVSSSPFIIAGETFSILTITDVSSFKRRGVLERIFFHDVMNTASALRGFAELLKTADPGRVEFMAESVVDLSNKLMNEIKSQKELLAAENDELSVCVSALNSLELLGKLASQFGKNGQAAGKLIAISDESEEIAFESDSSLLQRVLGNMVLNAVEASRRGDIVTIGCGTNEGNVMFWVHNPTIMSEESQLRVFKRSFSTKGPNRGLGTYSMKLLSERYLKGRVSFESSEDAGTTFLAEFPLTLSPGTSLGKSRVLRFRSGKGAGSRSGSAVPAEVSNG